MKNTRTLLGQRIRDARRQLKMNQHELAHLAGLSTRTVQSVEEGKAANPQVETVRAIASVLKTSLDHLVEGKAKPHSENKTLLLAIIDQLEASAISVLLSVAKALLASPSGDVPVKQDKRLG